VSEGGELPKGPLGGGAASDPVLRVARRYLRVSLFYLSLGSLLGLGMLAWGNDNFQFVHTHMLLVGGALFAFYAFGLMLIPGRFGRPGAIHAGWAQGQFVLANVGLAGMIAGALMPVGYGLDRIAVLFGAVEALSVVLYAWVIGAAFRD
jgi:hypothetical protein